MGVFEFLVIAVVVQGTSRIIVRWLRTRDGVSQRQIKALAISFAIFHPYGMFN